MFKIIIKKDTTLFITLTLLFSTMAQAMLLSNNIFPVRIAKTEREQAATTDILDQSVQHWDYRRFNWVRLYHLLHEYIDEAAFIKATQHGHTNIALLAQAIVNNPRSNIQTEKAAKFFIYSALKSLHAHYVENNWQQSQNFTLLQQVHSASGSEQLRDNLNYTPIYTHPDYTKQMLRFYAYAFIHNPEIKYIKLTNNFAELTTLINMYANGVVSKAFIPSEFSMRCPTVEQLLQQYDEDDHEIILAFLVSHQPGLELTGDSVYPTCLKTEHNLRVRVARAFRSLWNAASDAESEDLAKMAIAVFQLNLLNHNLHILQDADCISYSYRSGTILNAGTAEE